MSFETTPPHVWKAGVCRFCFCKEDSARQDCIRLPIKFEALERSSAELHEKYCLAHRFVTDCYMQGLLGFFFYNSVFDNNLTFCQLLLGQVDEVFIEHYLKESEHD